MCGIVGAQLELMVCNLEENTGYWRKGIDARKRDFILVTKCIEHLYTYSLISLFSSVNASFN